MPAPSDSVLTARGLVRIPAMLRSQLDLKPGQRFAWRVLPDGDLHLHVVREDAAGRREHWKAYVHATQHGRTSDDILAETRAADEDMTRTLGCEG